MPMGIATTRNSTNEMRAMESLRMEKSYRMWGSDLTPDYTPYEAGLDRFVRLNKGPFIGREALESQVKAGVPHRFITFEVHDVSDADARLRALRETHRGAHLDGDGARDLVVVFLVGGEDALHERQALLTRGARVRIEGAARRGDGEVHILGAAHRDQARHRFIGRVDDLEFLGLDRVDPSTIDVELPVVVLHGKYPRGHEAVRNRDGRCPSVQSDER